MIMQIRKPVLKFLSQKAEMFVDNTRLETNAKNTRQSSPNSKNFFVRCPP